MPHEHDSPLASFSQWHTHAHPANTIVIRIASSYSTAFQSDMGGGTGGVNYVLFYLILDIISHQFLCLNR